MLSLQRAVHHETAHAARLPGLPGEDDADLRLDFVGPLLRQVRRRRWAAKTSPRSTMVPPRRAPQEARDDPRCPGRDRARGGAINDSVFGDCLPAGFVSRARAAHH